MVMLVELLQLQYPGHRIKGKVHTSLLTSVTKEVGKYS